MMKRTMAALACLLIITSYGAAQSLVGKHPGLHPVRDANGKWGYIDRSGRFRIPPKYDDANEFSDGVACVWFWTGDQRKNGIVDPSGKFTELPAFNNYSAAFYDGLVRVQTPSGKERRHGFVDKSGRMVIETRFSYAGHFSEGLAWFSELTNGKWLYGFIDKTGKIVIEPQFVFQPGDFVSGLAKVMGQWKSGFIDRTGKLRIEVDYEKADSSFSEGLLAVVTPGEPSRGVYLDTNGKVVLEIPFWQQRTAWQLARYSLRHQQLGPFSEGLAPVLAFNKIGFIDRTAKVVIAPEFRETNGFSEGLAAVKIIGSDGGYVWGYINRKGELVIAPSFRIARPFRGGLARVTTVDEKEQLIDEKGKVVWQKAK